MKIKLIVNPAAGRKKVKKAIPAIKRVFTENNLDFDIDITGHPGETTYLSQKACKNNFWVIVSVGGDGTVHEKEKPPTWTGIFTLKEYIYPRLN